MKSLSTTVANLAKNTIFLWNLAFSRIGKTEKSQKCSYFPNWYIALKQYKQCTAYASELNKPKIAYFWAAYDNSKVQTANNTYFRAHFINS